MLAVPPPWQLGSQEFPEPTAMGDLETCPCVAKPILFVIIEAYGQV